MVIKHRNKIPIWWVTFVDEFLSNGENATEAFFKARPTVKRHSANAMAVSLFKNPDFKAYFEKRRYKLQNKIEMKREEWLKLLSEVARFNLANYIKTESGSGDTQLVEDWKSKEDSHVIENLDLQTTTLESGQVVQRVKIKAHDKLKALQTIGKALGYYEDKVNLNLNFSPVEVARTISQLRVSKSLEEKNELDDKEEPKLQNEEKEVEYEIVE